MVDSASTGLGPYKPRRAGPVALVVATGRRTQGTRMQEPGELQPVLFLLHVAAPVSRTVKYLGNVEHGQRARGLRQLGRHG